MEKDYIPVSGIIAKSSNSIYFGWLDFGRKRHINYTYSFSGSPDFMICQEGDDFINRGELNLPKKYDETIPETFREFLKSKKGLGKIALEYEFWMERLKRFYISPRTLLEMKTSFDLGITPDELLKMQRKMYYFLKNESFSSLKEKEIVRKIRKNFTLEIPKSPQLVEFIASLK